MKVAAALLMALVVSFATLAASSVPTPLTTQPSARISSLTQGMHRKLLDLKAAAAEATQSSGQTYNGWWHDVPLSANNGQYNGWWHDVPNVNPSGQYKGWASDVVPAWVAQGN